MGGGPIAPHLKDCPAGGYAVHEHRTRLSPRLPSTETHDWNMCSEPCANLRAGTEDMIASESSAKNSMVLANPVNNHSWMQAMANNYRLGSTTLSKVALLQDHQYQNGNESGRISRRRDEQLDIDPTNVEMSGDHYNWIQAMEIYHSSEQPNRAMCEGFCHGDS